MPTLDQPTFAGGEISPSLYGRVDLARYQTSLRTCKNMIVMRQGGVKNRAGFRFVREIKASADEVRLIPFTFSASQAYVLEFGNQYIRFYRQAGVVLWTPDTLWSAVTAYVTGDLVYKVISLVITPFRALQASTNKDPQTEPTYWVQDDVYEIPTPYSAADVQSLAYTQSADVMTLVHPDHPPYELRRLADDDWTLTAQARTPTLAAPANLVATPFDASTPQKDYEYVVTAVTVGGQESSPSTAEAITVRLTSEKPVSLTWDTVTGADTYNVYRARNGIFGYIGSTDTNAFEDDDIVPIYSDTPPTWDDPFDATDKYPSVVTYHQQRLCYAATNDEPETLWMSRTGDYANFGASSPPQDDDMIKATVAALKVQRIMHLVPLDRLVILTESGEWVVTAGQDDVVTPSTFGLRGQGNRGASSILPLLIGDSAIYVQRQGRRVRELAYSLEADKFTGTDLTIMATHFFDGYTIVDWAWAEEPDSVVWVVRSDGTLLGFTYMREQEVWAWHQHPTDGVVEHVAVIAEDGEDYLYAVVQRTIDGADVRYIERMASRYISDVREDAFFVDCGLTYDAFAATGSGLTIAAAVSAGTTFEVSAGTIFGSTAVDDVIVLRNGGDWLRLIVVAVTDTSHVDVVCSRDLPDSVVGFIAAGEWGFGVTAISGLDHLEGASVAILADGLVAPTATVSGGAITLDTPAVVVHVGLPYTAEIETLDIALPGQVTRDKEKVVSRVTLQVEASRGIWVGERDREVEYKQRSTEGYDDPIALATDAIEIRPGSRWTKHGRLVVQQRDPLPMSILAIMPEITNGG